MNGHDAPTAGTVEKETCSTAPAAAVEEGSFLFVEDAAPRFCPTCGTVFTQSIRAGLASGAKGRCPYCDGAWSRPILQ